MQDAPNRNQAPLFSPLLFRQDGKEGADGGNRQLQICDNLSVSAAPSQLPWKGSQGGAHRRRFSELRDNLSVSLRLTAPLEGGAFFISRLSWSG